MRFGGFGVPTQIAWLTIAFCLVFIFTLTIIGNETAIRVENYVGVAVSFAAFVRYRHDAWDALFSARPTGFQILALGIFVSWMGNLIRNIYSSVERDFGIGWVRWGPLVPVFLFLMVLGGIMHLAGPRMQGGRLPVRALVEIAAVVLAGVVAALAVTLTRLYLGLD